MIHPHLSKPVAAALLLAGMSGMSACSSLGMAKVPTCSEYAAMSSDSGLTGSLTKDQAKAIDNILTKHNKQSDSSNEMIAALQIVAYCNIVGTKAESHPDDPIDGIPGLAD
jgi:F0F1-type ATP synthase gamma subunit